MAEIVRRLCADEPPSAIAKSIGCDPTTVRRHAKRLREAGADVPAGRDFNPTTPEQVAEIGRLTAAGESSYGIARALGLKVSTVYQQMQQFGGPLRKRAFVPKLQPELIADIEQRVRAGEPMRSIARTAGVNQMTVIKYANALRRREGDALPVDCRCGLPIRHRGGCLGHGAGIARNEDGTWGDRTGVPLGSRKGDALYKLILAGASRKAAQRTLKMTGSQGAPFAARAWADLAAEGVLCGCGRPRGHRNTCSVYHGGRVARPIDAPLRARLVYALIQGLAVKPIAEAAGVSQRIVNKVLVSLTNDQWLTRRAAVADRLARTRSPAAATQAMRDKLYARIFRAMPKGLEHHLRDDVISEIILAVLEGDLPADRIEHEAPRYVNGGYRLWASRFGPRSLDETLGDTDLTLGDLIDDTTTAEMLDYMTIGDEA